MLLANPERCKALGAEARKTIVERFGMEKFVERWNDLFLRALKT
jgi:glycosyltransferase involved in cell wall biosynthesis